MSEEEEEEEEDKGQMMKRKENSKKRRKSIPDSRSACSRQEAHIEPSLFLESRLSEGSETDSRLSVGGGRRGGREGGERGGETQESIQVQVHPAFLESYKSDPKKNC